MVPVVQKAPTVRETSAPIGAVPSIEIPRVWSDNYRQAAYADNARKSARRRHDRPFLEADKGNSGGKD